MPSDANRSTVTLTTFHAWNGRKWIEQPAPPVTVTEGPDTDIWQVDSVPAPEWQCLGDPDNAPCTAAAPCTDCITIHYMRHVDLPTALREMQTQQDEDLHHHADRMLCGLVMALADRLGEADQVGAIVRAYNACPKWYE